MKNYPVQMQNAPLVEPFFDSVSNTISYVVTDPDTQACCVIDSVLDFDYASGRTFYDNANKQIEFIQSNKLTLEWIIESHVHADHLSAAPYLQEALGGKTGIAKKIIQVQDEFGKIFNEGTSFQRDGSQFDALFEDGDTYQIGNMQGFAMSTPGHTPACMVHVIGNAAFVGDTLFMPDSGSARVDFPGGDAVTLYDSIQKVLALPDNMRLFMCHDYGPNGRDIQWETSVLEQRTNNIHVGNGSTKESFVKMRIERDKQLGMPRLIIPALQVNMRAGEIPQDEDGNPMLKVPVNGL